MPVIPGPPTPEGFLAFVRGFMAIPTGVLPDDSPALTISYQIAIDTVNLQLSCASPDLYTLAVYNLGGDNLINYAPDVVPLVPYDVPGNTDGLPFFAYMRQKFGVFDFVAGVVQSSGDEGTNVSLVVQKAAENFTLSDLQNLKTPYGRRYLVIAQKVGTDWGLS